jgi:hypothetical protein
MNCDSEIRMISDERIMITRYLASRGYSLGAVEKTLDVPYFDVFISELSKMRNMLKDAEIAARTTGDVGLVGEILGARAKIQKDIAYGQFTKALGASTKFIEINGRQLEVVDAQRRGIEAMERSWKGPALRAIVDYVKQSFEEGVNKCSVILNDVGAMI